MDTLTRLRALRDELRKASEYGWREARHADEWADGRRELSEDIADRLDAIIADADAGWRDIASAPMDGTTVLVANRYSIAIAAMGGTRPPKWRDRCGYGAAITFSPTHWQYPPPPPPEEPAR